MPIHQTLTDNEGRTYRVVSSWWLKAVTIVAITNFLVLMLMIALLLETTRNLDDTSKRIGVTQERYEAIQELSRNRARFLEFTQTRLCELSTVHHLECMPYTTLWADPEHFKGLAEDPANGDLFPPKPVR